MSLHEVKQREKPYHEYPGIFAELHRVMAPGSRAYFLVGLADNPLFGLWWRSKGDVEEGDVPIFAAEVRHRAGAFRIIGMDFFHALKTFVARAPLSVWQRALLHATKACDDLLFRIAPAARRWGPMSIIGLEKDS